MAIDRERLLQTRLDDVEHAYGERDTLLYALGIGMGSDPLDAGQLRYVYEKNLLAVPSMASVLGYLKVRDMPLGINYLKTVHGEQAIHVPKPLPVQGTIVSSTRVVDVVDRGADKGAVIYLDAEIRDKASNELYATRKQVLFCRGDGGFCGAPKNVPAPHPIPQRTPDAVCELPTLPQQALIYRLSGDYNPLHADPDTARKAGFERPILHGLGTFGLICHAALKMGCDYDAARLVSLEGRFSAPVIPGDTVRVEIWREADALLLRASVPQRNAVVFNNGRARLA
jgi:acyl dehydratase